MDNGKHFKTETIENNSKEYNYNEVESKRIVGILSNQTKCLHCTECGSFVRIETKRLLEKEQVQAIKCEYVYGILSNLA